MTDNPNDGSTPRRAASGAGSSAEIFDEILYDLRVANKHIVTLRQELADARRRPAGVFIDFAMYGFLSSLARLSPLLPRSMVLRFARSAAKRAPLRSLAQPPDPAQHASEGAAPEARTHAIAVPQADIVRTAFDSSKPTIIVVSHDASRTGAPVLALNLVTSLREKYNIITILFGGGTLSQNFRDLSVSTYDVTRHDTKSMLDELIRTVRQSYHVNYAIVNSAESRFILRSLKEARIPTVCLVHEFAAYTRPRTSFATIFDNSDQVVFSTRITLENALDELGLTRGAAVRVIPQGKCAVPGGKETDTDSLRERQWLELVLRSRPSDDGAFVVLGAGTVEARKSVELFIECATRIINRPRGRRFRFVWIGDGYDPETGANNSFYLADQIRRAGLEGQVVIVRATSQIEYAYELADVLLLSSRLDPLPNVAIDALVAGKPVLCFERTTGIADFLLENGLGEACVASYLDTTALADKIRALAEDKVLYADIAHQAQAAARERFNFRHYAEQIDALAGSIVPADRQMADDAAYLASSSAFRVDFCGGDGADEASAIASYLRGSRTGQDMRKPEPGFHPAIFQMLHGDEAGADPYVRYLRDGRPTGPWAAPVIDGQSPTRARSDARLRLAMHVHVTDVATLADFGRRLMCNASRPKLFMSARPDIAEAVRATLQATSLEPEAFEIVPDSGQALAVLCAVFATRLSRDYDVIGHIDLHDDDAGHSKGRSGLLETFLGGERGGAMLDRMVAAMTDAPDMSLIYPDEPRVLAWGLCRPIADVMAARMALGTLPDQLSFPSAGAFVCRSHVLRLFADADFQWADYPSRDGRGKELFMDAIARLFGAAARVKSFHSAVTNVRGVSW